jgi:predicted GIY-YIG superfamily endonuclease
MPIHDCQHTFAKLASTVLPQYLKQIRVLLKQPLPMAFFSRPGVGVQTLLSELEMSKDFSGCYVLVKKAKPIYVGISRSVISRLRQHVTGKTHFSATLAYKIAASKHPKKFMATLSRAAAMKHPEFGVSFENAQRYLWSLNVAFIPIANPLELYIFEPYCAMQLNTHQWNVFETH